MSKTTSTTHSNRFYFLAGIAAGLYPVLHYYNGNLEMADSWIQLVFLVGTGMLLPILLLFISKPVFRVVALQKFEKYRPAAINLAFFFGLLAMLIFQSNRKIILLVFIGGALLSFLLYKHLSKIVVLQYLLAATSLFLFVPKAIFAFNHTNDWAKPTDAISDTQFKLHPNIYVIQPDGYTSFSTFKEAPYNHPDTAFETWLDEAEFVHYDGFRSNYYSTLTSNSSLFAMKHHYYGNTFTGNLKTFDSQEVIAGKNTTIATLKNNGYQTHLITDNSYFLINRKSSYDYCNITTDELSLYRPGGVRGVDMMADFKEVVATLSNSHNFFFIEKTIPGHIAHGEGASMGVEAERDRYLDRVKKSEVWMQELINTIRAHDKNPMIVIVADHGGYVGLNYVKEVLEKKLTPVEVNSVFSSLLSIRWPSGEVPQDLEITSSVNLFRYIFSYLSGDEGLLDHLEKDQSFLPFDDGSGIQYYEYLDANGKAVFNRWGAD